MAHTLFICDGESFREARAQLIIDRAAALIAQRFRTGAPALSSPDRTRQYLRHQIGALPYEVFGLVLLDNRHRLILAEVLFRGTIDGASVHPREVVRTVLEANAAAASIGVIKTYSLSITTGTASGPAGIPEAGIVVELEALELDRC